MMKRFLLLLFCFIAEIAFGQEMQIDRIDVRGNKIIIWYDLKDPNADRKYAINIFSSLDGFTAPLAKVKGDVGMDIKPGADKKITWDIIAELGAFKGNLIFKIIGNVQAPFVNLAEFKEGLVFKRGRNYPITWASGNKDGKVNIELYKNKELVWSIENLPNNGKYDWAIPEKAKSSKHYRLKFTNAVDPNDFLFTSSFTIKPRTPMILKAGAVLVLGAGATILGGKSGNSYNNSLADPPSTPGK